MKILKADAEKKQGKVKKRAGKDKLKKTLALLFKSLLIISSSMSFNYRKDEKGSIEGRG